MSFGAVVRDFYLLEPEVAGEPGAGSLWDASVHPPIVKKLELSLSGWLGDDLLECFPCFIVSARLASGLTPLLNTTAVFEKIRVLKSEQFLELYPDRDLPDFYWLRFSAGKDLFLSEDGRLAVSARVMDILRQFNINNATVECDTCQPLQNTATSTIQH